MADPEATVKTSFARVFVDSGVGWRGIPLFAQIAMVEPETVYEMISGDPVPAKEATRVLAVLSPMIGTAYTLENVAIKTIEEDNDTTKQSGE